MHDLSCMKLHCCKYKYIYHGPAKRHSPRLLVLSAFNSPSLLSEDFLDATTGDMGQGSLTASGSGILHGLQTRELATVKEEMDRTVTEFQWFVNLLGTPMDTPELRKQLQNRWLHAHQLARETSTLFKESDHMEGHLNDVKKANEARVAQDFLAIVGRFNEAQLLAAEKQPPFVPQLDITTSSSSLLGSSRTIDETEVNQTPQKKDSDVKALLDESKRMLALLQDSENTLQEAMTEGDEEEVQQLQAQIDTLRMIFRDLITVLEDYGVEIDDVSLKIENSASASSRATSQLLRAAKAPRPSSFLDCFCRILGSCFTLGT